jgi:hypothetical protein
LAKYGGLRKNMKPGRLVLPDIDFEVHRGPAYIVRSHLKKNDKCIFYRINRVTDRLAKDSLWTGRAVQIGITIMIQSSMGAPSR